MGLLFLLFLHLMKLDTLDVFSHIFYTKDNSSDFLAPRL